MTHQYQLSTNLRMPCDPPDHRYLAWDKRSRKELAERLNATLDRRRNTIEKLISNVIKEELNMYRISIISNTEMKDDNHPCSFIVSDENVMKPTKEVINKQINEWKGLRWWRFNENNACDSWNKWFKKCKIWQDVNSYKPLGPFWCLIFEQLKLYTNNIAYNTFSNCNELNNMKDLLSLCLYNRCILSILKGTVNCFVRTREAPLLATRTLIQSKQLQQILYKIDNKFTLLIWRQDTQLLWKQNTPQLGIQRYNMSTILHKKCLEWAENVYQENIKQLKQLISSYLIIGYIREKEKLLSLSIPDVLKMLMLNYFQLF
eukprot:4898_1